MGHHLSDAIWNIRAQPRSTAACAEHVGEGRPPGAMVSQRNRPSTRVTLAAGTASDPLQAGNHYSQDHDVRSSVVPARPAVSPSIDQEPSFVHCCSYLLSRLLSLPGLSPLLLPNFGTHCRLALDPPTLLPPLDPDSKLNFFRLLIRTVQLDPAHPIRLQ